METKGTKNNENERNIKRKKGKITNSEFCKAKERTKNAGSLAFSQQSL